LRAVQAWSEQGEAAEYIKALTHDQQIWKDSIVGTKTAHPGQLPPYNSIYADWTANKPDWMPPFVSLVRGQLDRARAIKNHVFGLQQFVIAKPIWETYLKGEEADPKVAMQKAMAAVAAEVKKG
jgi:multiple sugar transport system substrate-binding protein